MKGWQKLLLGIMAMGGALVTLAVTAIAVLKVPAPNSRTVTPLEVTFVRSGDVLDADPEDDLFIYVEEYASPFRINRAAEAGFMAEQFVLDVQAGEAIEIYAYNRYLPDDPQTEIRLGSIPTWNILHGETRYIPERVPAELE